jgi:hypothetical protein
MIFKLSLRERALHVNELAIKLAEGFLCHHAAMTILKDPKSKELYQGKTLEQMESIGKFGNTEYRFDSYYDMAVNDPFILEEFEKMWCVGAIQKLDHELKKNKYFDHAPILEMIHHFRNGVAHGNKFVFENKIKHPANNFEYVGITDMKNYELTEKLKGKKILFDFITANDLLQIFQGVANHLNNNLNFDKDVKP